MSYTAIVALLKTALLLLSLAQGPNVPQSLQDQAVSVANKAIAAATLALGTSNAGATVSATQVSGGASSGQASVTSQTTTPTPLPATTPTPNPSTAPGPSILSGSFDPVTWMSATKGVGSVKTYGEIWDSGKQTWTQNGGPANPMKMLADYTNGHVYFHKDSSWQDFVGQTYNFNAAGVWTRTETMGYFNCTDVNPSGGRCDNYSANTPWDIRNDKFRLFVSTNDSQSASHGYLLAPRPVSNGWQGTLDTFDTYYCNSFAELSASTCSLYQKGNKIFVTVSFLKNYDIFNDAGDHVVSTPNGTPQQRLFDVMIVSIEEGQCDPSVPAGSARCIARERNIYGRAGTDYWGLVRFDSGLRKNGAYELTDRAVAYGWDTGYDPKLDALKTRALADDGAHFTPPAVIAQPTELVATCNAAGTQATLSWNPANNATGYWLRADDTTNQSIGCSSPSISGPNASCVVTTDYVNNSAMSPIIISVPPNKAIAWWVHTVVGFNQSAPVVGTTFTCVPSAPPTQPTALTATCSSDGTHATFSWSPVPGATLYALRVDDTTNEASGCVSPSVTGAGSSCVSPTDYVYDSAASPMTLSVPAGKALSWWVHALLPSGPSAPSIGTTITCNPS